MARVKNRDTSPEMLLRRALWRSGFRYRVHKKIPGRPDLCFTGLRLAIFVDGCFWHGCREDRTEPVINRDYWRAKFERNRLRDQRVDAELQALGWSVIRVWEHEVERELRLVVARIAETMRAATSARLSERLAVHAGGQTSALLSRQGVRDMAKYRFHLAAHN